MLGRKMRITKHQDTEVLDWRVRLWLDYRRIPLQDYRNLPPHCKDWLHDAVCGGARAPSDRQLRDLAQELHLSELRTDVRPNGHSSRPVELIPHHDLREFFSLPADETRRHLSRY
jgi:hypothetical protein